MKKQSQWKLDRAHLGFSPEIGFCQLLAVGAAHSPQEKVEEDLWGRAKRRKKEKAVRIRAGALRNKAKGSEFSNRERERGAARVDKEARRRKVECEAAEGLEQL